MVSQNRLVIWGIQKRWVLGQFFMSSRYHQIRSRNLIASSQTALDRLLGTSAIGCQRKADHDKKMGINGSQGQFMVIKVRAFCEQSWDQMKTISVIQELMLCWCPLRNYGMVRPFRMSLAGEWRRKDQKKGIRTRTQKWQSMSVYHLKDT